MNIIDIIKKFRRNESEDMRVYEGEDAVSCDTLLGTFCGHAKGFGFVTVEGEEEDFFVSKENTNNAMDGDTVEIEQVYGGGGKRKEAKITSIINHAVTSLVGTYNKTSGGGFVTPDNRKIHQEIFVKNASNETIPNGQKVVCRILRYATEHFKAEGAITQILGHKDDPGVDILSLAMQKNVPYEFSKEVMEKAIAVSKPVAEEDYRGRLDLRDVRMVTIDGDDTKDFDDAVSIARDGEEYILGVHIADVSHYVTEGSALDDCARKRAASIYLADRVIPMLPHTLSNGICSLNEGEDRLALSCIMRFNRKGKIVEKHIAETVIKVTHRMTYKHVNRILLHKDARLMRKYADVVDDFKDMARLSKLIRKRREKHGSIDFDFTESKILIDKDGHPYDIKPYVRGISEMMIEDFMISANKAVAEVYFRKEIPFIYRIHDRPDMEKIIDLKRFVAKFGFNLRGDASDMPPKELQRLLYKIKGTPEENLIQILVLRSMQRAEYNVDERGHYGLAAEFYCHFTSPIRRYPDLMIHRIIKEDIHAGKLKRKRKAHYAAILPQVASSSTTCEKRADELERDVDKMKKAEYMTAHIGKVFQGTISGVTGWGIYVALPNTVEGLIPMRSLRDDFYIFEEDSYEIVGEHSGRTFRLGDEIRVRVVSCDKEMHTIDFALADEDKHKSTKNKIKKHKSKNNKAKYNKTKNDDKNGKKKKINRNIPKKKSRTRRK